MTSIILLALPIYNIALGVDVVKLGWALSLPRIIDAFFDPLVGWISDNTRSRWGRRKPYLIAGAFPLAFLTLLLWMPPTSVKPDILFWYFLISSIFYYLAYSICTVPHAAIGMELPNDYNDRTRVAAWAQMFNMLGSLLASWLYKLTLLPVFGGNEVAGVRWVGGLIAVINFGSFIIPGIFCEERFATVVQNKIGLIDAFRETLKNIPFRFVIGILFVGQLSIVMATPFLFYLNIFQICGDKVFAAKVMGWAGTVQLVACIAAIPFNLWLGKKVGKNITMFIGLAIAMLGLALYTVTLTPEFPYLQLVSSALVGWGIQGVWLMASSMMFDVCDDDEMNTGHRREAFYGASGGICVKGVLAVAALLSAYMIRFAGYHVGVTPSSHVLANLRHMFIWSQFGGLAICALIISFYPLTRKRMAEISEELEKRRSRATVSDCE